MTEQTLSAHFLLTLIHHLQQTGVSAAIIEQQSGINIDQLNRAGEQNQHVSIHLYGKLYRFYLQQMAAENFGFSSGIRW